MKYEAEDQSLVFKHFYKIKNKTKLKSDGLSRLRKLPIFVIQKTTSTKSGAWFYQKSICSINFSIIWRNATSGEVSPLFNQSDVSSRWECWPTLVIGLGPGQADQNFKFACFWYVDWRFWYIPVDINKTRVINIYKNLTKPPPNPPATCKVIMSETQLPVELRLRGSWAWIPILETYFL